MTGNVTWIFGYGSLIWRPDFPFVQKKPAIVLGWARRFWQGSPDHRGTPECPGRVVTMLRWPSKYCTGIAYAVAEEDSEEVLAQLDMREVAGYERIEVPIRASREALPFAKALTFVATTSNTNFLGMASEDEMVAQIAQAHGSSGSNVEYVLRLADALQALGATESDSVFGLAARLASDE